jgi:hypothetical protein
LIKTHFNQKKEEKGLKWQNVCKMFAKCLQIFDPGNAIITSKMATLKLALDMRRAKKDGTFEGELQRQQINQ